VKKVLVATDGSPSAGRALDVAARLAADSQAELTILTAAQLRLSPELKEFGRTENLGVDEIQELEASSILSKAQARVTDVGIKKVTTLARQGDPAEAILSAAKELRADAIVMGRRGRGRLEGLLLGSVSQKVVSLAPCAVITVP